MTQEQKSPPWEVRECRCKALFRAPCWSDRYKCDECARRPLRAYAMDPNFEARVEGAGSVGTVIDIGIDLKRKDNTVSLQLDPAFKLAAPVLRTAWIMYGVECVVTSGSEATAKHSTNSAHYQKRAVDLRHWNLPVVGGVGHVRFGTNLAKALVQSCGPYWYVVLEYKNPHFHVEYAPPGTRPNIIAWRDGVHFYEQGK